MVPGGVWLQTPGPTQKRNGSNVSISGLMTFDLFNDTKRPPEGRMPHALEGRSGGGVLGATGTLQQQWCGGGDHPPSLHNFDWFLKRFTGSLIECHLHDFKTYHEFWFPASGRAELSALNSN